MKRAVWLGSSREDVSSFPADARREIGYELYQVQQGLEPSDWKALSTLGPGVYEIRIHTENEYRAVYVTKFAEAIMSCTPSSRRRVVCRNVMPRSSGNGIRN